MPTRPTSLAAVPWTDTTVVVPGAAPLALRVHGTRKPRSVVPLVLHFHGGAFTSGDLDSGACMAMLLVRSGAIVVSLAYPLAPAHRFPEAVEAGYAALQWCYRQRNKLAGKGARLYLAGDEAGGNLAAAVALVARDREHPPLAGQILVAPMLDPCVGTASLRESQGCQAIACKWAEGWQQYLRGPMDAEHPYAVPGKATRLAGLPPALVLTGADDPMRDEALAYAQRLRDAGIPVTGKLLHSHTGWPESLAEPPVPECAYAAGVERDLREFFSAGAPPPT